MHAVPTTSFRIKSEERGCRDRNSRQYFVKEEGFLKTIVWFSIANDTISRFQLIVFSISYTLEFLLREQALLGEQDTK